LPDAAKQAKKHPMRVIPSISALSMRANHFSFFFNPAALLQLLRHHPIYESLK
jgi:precorrin-6B methylase 1